MVYRTDHKRHKTSSLALMLQYLWLISDKQTSHYPHRLATVPLNTKKVPEGVSRPVGALTEAHYSLLTMNL